MTRDEELRDALWYMIQYPAGSDDQGFAISPGVLM